MCTHAASAFGMVRRRVGLGQRTGQVDEDVAAIVGEQPFGARCAGGKPARQDTQEVLHCHLGGYKAKGGSRVHGLR